VPSSHEVELFDGASSHLTQNEPASASPALCTLTTGTSWSFGKLVSMNMLDEG